MRFALRYFLNVLKTIFFSGLRMLAVMAAAGFIIGLFGLDYNNLSLERYLTPLFYVLGAVGIWLFFVLLLTVIEFSMTYKIRKVFNEKGYCLEYFYAFQDLYIKKQPKHPGNLISFAEIYVSLGDCNSALNIFESIKTYELTAVQRVSYIYIYTITAVKMNNPALADEIWRQNEDFISVYINKPDFISGTAFLYYSMIFADCLSQRYERAYHTCISFMNSPSFKKLKTIVCDYHVMKIFLLRKLGRDSEVNAAVTEFNEAAKKWKPLYDYARENLRKDVEKAIRGELPV